MKRLTLIFPLLLLFSCNKAPEPVVEEEEYCIDKVCQEAGIKPIFRFGPVVKKFTLVTYENNDRFDKVVTVQERFTDDDSMKKYSFLNSKFDYDIQVEGYDTFRISRFVSRPRTERRCGNAIYTECFYPNDSVIVNGVALVPSLGGGPYYSLLIVDRK